MKLPIRPESHVTEAAAFKCFISKIPDRWIVRELTERDYGIDCYLEIVNSNNLVTGMLLSIQLKGLTLTHTSDALLQTLNVLTHTTDAFKLKKASLTHNTDGYLQLVVEPSHTTDAALQKFDLDITHKTDAYLGVVIRITHTTDSIIQEMQNLRTHSTDAILTGSFSGAFAQVVLKREDRKTVTFSRIKKSTVVFAREKQNVGVIQ